MNQFQGGPQINENFESLEKPKDPLINLDGKEIKLNGGGLYKPFVLPENKTDNLKNNQEQTKDNKNEGDKIEKKGEISKIKENPNFPILERFSKITEIQFSENEISQLGNILENNKDGEDNKNPLESLKDKLTDIKFEDSKTFEYLSNFINKTLESNKDEKKEIKDDNGEQKYELPKEFENKTILNKEDDPIVQILIKNYTKIPDGKDGNPNPEKDINTAFEISANKIIENKQFTRNDLFENAMKEVKTGDLETRYNALSYIKSLVNTEQGIQSAKTKELISKLSPEQKEKYTQIQEQIKAKEEQVKQEQDPKKKENLEQEIISLKKQEQEISSGEVFKSAKEDKTSETNNTQNTNPNPQSPQAKK